jgi:hypothetical protein
MQNININLEVSWVCDKPKIKKHIGLTVLKDFFVDIYLVYYSLDYSFLHKFFFF